MQSNSIEIRPVSGAIGAEITGMDLAEPLAGQACDVIRQTLADRGVVFFRGQSLTPEQHISFARQFGDINVNRFFAHADGYPEIALVVKEPDQKKNIGGGWHTDHSYDRSPALGSILYAREVPPAGGDTLFASMYAAYEALSDGSEANARAGCVRCIQPPRVRRGAGGYEGPLSGTRRRRFRTQCIRW